MASVTLHVRPLTGSTGLRVIRTVSLPFWLIGLAIIVTVVKATFRGIHEADSASQSGTEGLPGEADSLGCWRKNDRV